MKSLRMIKREFTDYWDCLNYYLEELKKEQVLNYTDYFKYIDEVFSLYKVSKAEYFTNPENIPILNLEWKVYDLWSWVWFWSIIQKMNNPSINITWLEINQKWIDLANEIKWDLEIDFKQFDLMKQEIEDKDFTLIWNPPFDRYFMKSIITLIKKSKLSYLMFPVSWLPELQKNWIKCEEIKMENKWKMFTWKVKSDAWLLFKCYNSENANNEELFQEINLRNKTEHTIRPSWELFWEIATWLSKIQQQMWELYKTSRNFHLSFWGDEYIAQNRFYYYEHLPIWVSIKDINNIVNKFPIEQIREWDKEWCNMSKENMIVYHNFKLK